MSKKIKWLIAALSGVTLVIVYVLNEFPAEGFTSKKLTPITEKTESSLVVATQNLDAPNNTGVELEDTNVINAKAFNAKGDGVTNDTVAIQAAVDDAADSGGIVVIPAGIYLIDAVQSIQIKSGVTLKMTPNTILKAIPNDVERYAVLTIKDASNVTILGGVIEGEREQHTGITGEWGMGIRIAGAHNVTVKNTVCKDLWGDGFIIGTGTAGKPSEDIRLIDVRADNNRRQGISLITGRRIEIIRPRLTNSNGTAPSSGIDIEPDWKNQVLEGIKIVEPHTAGNAGPGILVCLQKLHGTGNPVSIQIINHRDDGSDRGMLIASRDTIVPGSLLIENPEWVNSKKNGLSIQKHDHRSFRIAMKQPRIIDANRSGKRDGITRSAIAIQQTSDIGNIHIHNPVISESIDASKIVVPFFIREMPNQEIRELIITDPVIQGSLVKLPASVKRHIKYTQKQM